MSFPALLAVGQPAFTANVTSTLGIWPGYLGGVVGFRAEITDQADRLRSLLPATLAGAAGGAVLLLTTSPDAFEAITPFLIVLACALFAAQPLLARKVAARAVAPGGELRRLVPERGAAVQAATFVSAAYGAYFGAGLGIVLLAVLGILLPDHLVRTNGLRSVLSLATNSVAAVLFVLLAPVAWGAAGLLAVSSLVGGYVGARTARHVPAPLLRSFVITVGLIAAGRLLLG